MKKPTTNSAFDVSQAEEYVEAMIAEIGQEQFDELKHQSYCYRIITAIYYCGTTDVKVLANDIFEKFDKQIPYEHIIQIVCHYIPYVLNDDGAFVNGELTPDAIEVAKQHNVLLSLGYPELNENKLH